ncbi:MAG: thymidylate kinase, partial [Planctomycetaceae bacterium]
MARLIAIEGIDGAGKGTQASRLKESLAARGLRAAVLQFPRYSATSFGAAIGDFLNGRFGTLAEVHPQLAAVLYAGDRFESRGLLLELMEQHDVVVLDRFVGSNLAHQASRLTGAARLALIEWIERIEFGVFQLPRPDLTVLIDMSSQMSRELVSRKGQRDYTEREADLQESD